MHHILLSTTSTACTFPDLKLLSEFESVWDKLFGSIRPDKPRMQLILPHMNYIHPTLYYILRNAFRLKGEDINRVTYVKVAEPAQTWWAFLSVFAANKMGGTHCFILLYYKLSAETLWDP